MAHNLNVKNVKATQIKGEKSNTIVEILQTVFTWLAGGR